MKLRFLLPVVSIMLTGSVAELRSAQLVEVDVLDRDVLVVHVSDGDVIHHEGSTGEEVVRYTPELDVGASVQAGSWTVTSAQDPAYSGAGQHPQGCFRKTKLSGHAQMEWVGNDYRYEYTYEHWIYLELPSPMQQGMTYTVGIDPGTNIDGTTAAITTRHDTDLRVPVAAIIGVNEISQLEMSGPTDQRLD